MRSPIKVLIVDDHPMVAKGIAVFLKENERLNLDVLESVSSAEGLFSCLETESPDVIILDINLPGKSGIEMIDEILAIKPTTDVLIFSMHLSPEYAKIALGKGAKGYVVKESMPHEIITAIETILNDGVYLSPVMALALSGSRQEADGPILSDREIKVLELVSSGLTSKHVARELGISYRTVETHRRNIHSKLGSRSIAEAISIAADKQILGRV